jgi:hypothetical protein
MLAAARTKTPLSPDIESPVLSVCPIVNKSFISKLILYCKIYTQDRQMFTRAKFVAVVGRSLNFDETSKNYALEKFDILSILNYKNFRRSNLL